MYESEKEKQTDTKPDKKETPKKPTKSDVKEFNQLINKEEMGIYRELFQRFFMFWIPKAMLKALYNTNSKNENGLVDMIKSGLKDLKNEIEKMSEDEIKTEKPNKIVNIVERFFEFNRQNQEGQGLKILTPDKMLSRLPITLAQLKAGKLKNEIRQLLYSLDRSKKLTKTIYPGLINTI